MNPKVDLFLSKASKWQEEMTRLRTIILDCGLSEDLKWGKPCYTYENSNVVIVQGFKEYCALLFVKGALLKDEMGILITQTENVQAARQIRFVNIQEIAALEATIKAYVFETVEIEKSGLKVPFKAVADFSVPEEFKHKMDGFPELKEAFDALTPGRQRAYLLYFAQPKQSKTREVRIEKSIPMIFEGKGLND